MDREKYIKEFELLTGCIYDILSPLHVSIVDDMEAFRKSQAGNEGTTNTSLGGVSETYRNDYPKHVLRLIATLRKRVRLL